MKKILLLAVAISSGAGLGAGSLLASSEIARTGGVPSMVQTILTYKEIKNAFPALSGFLSFFTYLTTDRLVRAYDMNPQLFVDYDKAVQSVLRLLNEGSQIPLVNIPAKAANAAALAKAYANLAALHAQVTALFAVAL